MLSKLKVSPPFVLEGPKSPDSPVHREMTTSSEPGESRFSTWLKGRNFGKQAIGAFKTGLAAVLCVWLGNLLGLEHSYWAAVSAIVVMAYDTTLTFASCRDRIIGTAIGA